MRRRMGSSSKLLLGLPAVSRGDFGDVAHVAAKVCERADRKRNYQYLGHAAHGVTVLEAIVHTQCQQGIGIHQHGYKIASLNCYGFTELSIVMVITHPQKRRVNNCYKA